MAATTPNVWASSRLPSAPQRWKRVHCRGVAILLLAVVTLLVSLASATVVETKLLGIDLGAQSIKASAYTVSYLTPTSSTPEVKIILNDQTNRKSPSCVALRYLPAPPPQTHLLERSFAEPADALLYRFPFQTVCHPLTLLTHRHSNEPSEAFNASSVPHGDLAPLGFSLSRLGTGANTTRYSTVLQLLHPNRTAQMVVVPYQMHPGMHDHNELESAIGAIGQHAQQSHQDPLKEPRLDVSSPLLKKHFALFTAEEILSMFLQQARRLAEKSDAEVNRVSKAIATKLSQRMRDAKAEKENDAPLENTVRHATLVISSDLTVAERQALMDAGAIAGIRVFRLLHSSTAAMYQLLHLKGPHLVNMLMLHRHYDATGKAAEPRRNGVGLKNTHGMVGKPFGVYVMIFDMGYQRSEATVFELSKPSKDLQTVADTLASARQGGLDSVAEGSHVEAVVRRMVSATSDSLGGHAFDHCIASYWDETYFEGQILSPPLPTSGVATPDQVKDRLALLRAAEQVRERLSVNQAVPITIERLYTRGSSIPFTTTLNRTTFEERCAALFREAVQLAEDAWSFIDDMYVTREKRRFTLAKDEMAPLLPRLERLELVGAAARMPFLQSELGALPTKSIGYTPEHPAVTAQQTLNADEAMVMGAIHLAASQLQSAIRLPRHFLVHETLDHNIYFHVTPPASLQAKPRRTASLSSEEAVEEVEEEETEDGAAVTLEETPVTLLFPRRAAHLPTVYTVELPDRENPFIFSLYSPPVLSSRDAFRPEQADEEVRSETRWLSEQIFRVHQPSTLEKVRHAAGGSPPLEAQMKPGCFAMHYHISDVDRMLEALHVAAVRDSFENDTYRVVHRVLDSTVSVGVSLTESGVPLLHKAFLDVQLERRAYQRHPLTAPAVGEEDVPREEEVSNATEGGEDRSPSAEAPEVEERAPPQEAEAPAREEMDGLYSDWVEVSHIPLNRSVVLKAEVVEGGKVIALNQSLKPHPHPLSPVTKLSTPAAATTQVEVVLPVGSNMNAAELRASHTRLAALQQTEAELLQRGQLRNEIESVLLHIRTSDVWEYVHTFAQHASAEIANHFATVWKQGGSAGSPTSAGEEEEEEVLSSAGSGWETPLEWQSTVELVARWLEQDGELAETRNLTAQLDIVMAAKKRMETVHQAVVQFAAAAHGKTKEGNADL